MIHFLLAPDSPSALKLKRLVAEQGGRTDVIVGSWPELLMQARNSFILPVVTDDWHARLAEGVDAQKDAFWSKSYAAVLAQEQKSIVTVIGEHLIMLLEGVGVAGMLEGLGRLASKPRLQRHVKDFADLHAAMGHILPPGLLPVREMLQAAPIRMLRSMRVYHVDAWPHLNRWQEALIGHLNATATEPESVGLRELLGSAIAMHAGKAGSSLRFMQERLFTLPPKQELDTTMQWLVVRDYLQEVEVAAGMIQQALREDTTLQFADIAILLPIDQHYSHAVRSVFDLAGLPVSGLQDAYSCRDLGGEAVLNLLLSLDKPAPVLALASLLASPLMPWGKGVGNSLAQKVVELRFDLKEPVGFSTEQCKMLQLIRERVDRPAELKERLMRFPALFNREEAMQEHRLRAEQLCHDLTKLLENTSTVPWPVLIAHAVPEALAASTTSRTTREGIAVFYENAEPWRSPKRLYVLGCFDGHYPLTPAGSIIFTDNDLRMLDDTLGLNLETSKERNGRQRELFKRQTGAATNKITFFVPSRDALGKALSPSASLTFAGALFAGDGGAERLLANLESKEERTTVPGLALADEKAPGRPRELVKEDLSFGLNLLDICPNEDGTAKSETPSRLDTLLVSPLAWLLERLKVKPRTWEPETLSVLTKGTLAHDVFEHLFAAKNKLPGKEGIEQVVPQLLEQAINKKCPFLKRIEWKVEREHLTQDIIKSACQWMEVLKTIDAKVVATEISLQGMLENLPINGNADLLLELCDRQLLVVDYKKSSSSSRQKRMEAGYDLQAELYKTMIQSGGAQDTSKVDPEVLRKLEYFKTAGEIGTLYYLMNDQTALSNTNGWLVNIGGVNEIEKDSSRMAMNDIKSILQKLTEGKIALNTESDEDEFYKKRGLSTYALDTPLVKLFLKPGAAAEATPFNDSTEPTDA
jgi:hypothetical protein